ncbi:MAG: TlpA disulfide reductase family protein [Capsulimonas sp.]|uniref:TlpA family protein disulfide reductase n=1 Tax=Capsulimonas sp. TaxID=2494211 RepID=UPI0032669F86
MRSLVGLVLVGVIALAILSMKTQWEDNIGKTGELIPAAHAKAAPNFTLPEMATGRMVDLQTEARKQPIVFSFWATWCGPCREELPKLQTLSEKYRGRVQFYGVNSDDSLPDAKKFLAKNNLTFPMLLDDQHAAHNGYGVESIPMLFVIDTSGKVRAITEGYSVEASERLPKVLDALLAEK